MAKTKMVHARIEDDLKTDVEAVFKKLGLTTTEAIKIFFNQVKMRRGFPFPIEIPNDETRQVFEDTDSGKDLTQHKSIDAMFKHLRAQCEK